MGASPSTPPKTPAAFTPENLARYRAVVFLNSSGEVLDDDQKKAFQAFIRGGGGLAAIHQGITTLEKWPWYVALVGGVKFAGHPKVQQATCRCELRDHPATKELPESWTWTDEWYNFAPNPPPAYQRPDHGRRVVVQGRGHGQGPPHLVVSRRLKAGASGAPALGTPKKAMHRRYSESTSEAGSAMPPDSSRPARPKPRPTIAGSTPRRGRSSKTMQRSGAKGFETLAGR